MIVLMLMGCQQSMLLVIPANLKKPCPDLQKLESGESKDVILTMVDDRRKYIDCQQRHTAIISIIEKQPST